MFFIDAFLPSESFLSPIVLLAGNLEIAAGCKIICGESNAELVTHTLAETMVNQKDQGPGGPCKQAYTRLIILPY